MCTRAAAMLLGSFLFVLHKWGSCVRLSLRLSNGELLGINAFFIIQVYTDFHF